MPNAWLLASAITGYLLGSLPFGYLVARAHGVDIFKVGSKNPGATNVKRVLGPKAGNTVMALDMVKGAVASGWPLLPFVGAPDPVMLGLVGVIAAVLGHSFSIFTRFKGGKGVATAAGGLLVLIPVAGAIAAATWVVVFYAFRYVSLASILGAVAVIVASWLLPYHIAIRIVATVIGLFVIIRHRENISRLMAGTENKFAKKPPVES
ncbi:MAG: glycerol-3-phosphate 1-O-acyltransferase PlsY [Lacunisphaera sp.]|nr:glycerol-3-phosphate 1-O-acyltransferase PlsY [Lacunisphaera sp.]